MKHDCIQRTSIDTRGSASIGQLRWWFSMSIIVLLMGCETDRELRYLGKNSLQHYRDYATSIDYTDVHQLTSEDALSSHAPRTLLDRSKDDVRDLTLNEAVQVALDNSRILRIQPISISQQGTIISDSAVLQSPDNAPSVYDPAIQESGVLFGRRGVEAALASFDTQLTTSMTWGRNEQLQNNLFFSGGVSTATTESGVFQSGISKSFANGGNISLSHNWNYNGTNTPFALFGSTYAGNVQAEYRLPVLAGSGTEFTRIAGPFNPAFGNITGVSQGVVIARINQDLTLADFRQQVENLVNAVHRSYWDLYCQYRQYDAAVKARERAREFWRKMHDTLKAGGNQGFKIAHEREARATYFQHKAQAQQALAAIYEAETAFRMLLQLPVNDGQILRPSDEPSTIEAEFDWRVSLTEALTNRVELHKQKWNIKSLELQLLAARSLTRPSMDFVSSYQVNGLGDHLLVHGDDNDGRTSQGLNSAYETILQGNHTGWNLGFSFSMPFGFRSALAQVRNYELRLAKARHMLANQEQEIAGQLGNSFQQVARHYAVMRTNWNYLDAARKTLFQYDETQKHGGPINESGALFFNAQLRAQQSLIAAERAFYQSLCDYNKAQANLLARKGTTLSHFNISLAEGPWTPAAYRDALRRAWSRSHGFATEQIEAEPGEFVIPGAYGPPQLPVPEELDALVPQSEAGPISSGNASSIPKVAPAEEEIAPKGVLAAPGAEPFPIEVEKPKPNSIDLEKPKGTSKAPASIKQTSPAPPKLAPVPLKDAGSQLRPPTLPPTPKPPAKLGSKPSAASTRAGGVDTNKQGFRSARRLTERSRGFESTLPIPPLPRVPVVPDPDEVQDGVE